MSTNQITPERIAELRERVERGGTANAWRRSEHLAVLDALESSRAEVQRLTEARAIRACECSPEEACAHVRRAEAAEREVQRLTEESRRSGAGRVEVPDLPGHVWSSAHDADSRDQCISEVRDWYRDWIFSRLSSSPQPSAEGKPLTAGEIRQEIALAVKRGAYCTDMECTAYGDGIDRGYKLALIALRSSTNHDSKEN